MKMPKYLKSLIKRKRKFEDAVEEKDIPSPFAVQPKSSRTIDLQKALANHPVWGQFSEQERPRTRAEMTDVFFLRHAQSRQRLRENQPIAWPANHPKRLANLPFNQWPEEYKQKNACPTCNGQEVIPNGIREKTRHVTRFFWKQCPECITPEKTKRRKIMLNKRWPIDANYQKLASTEWIDSRRRVPNAHLARQTQQELMEQMPSSKTLFLYGVPGVGKSHLMAQIAVEARNQGLTSIIRTAENIRMIIQNYPGQSDVDSVRNEKQKRLNTARQDLRHVDVLIIDELDDARGPAIQAELLDIVNCRLGKELTTCFAANTRPGNKLSFLSNPLRDRLLARHAFHVELAGKSMRQLVGV